MRRAPHRVAIVVAVAVMAAVFPLGALSASTNPRPDVADTRLDPDGFLAAFDDAILDGLAPIGPPPPIFGDPVLDARIRAIGEGRGYRRRANPDRPLVLVDGFRLQPEAAAAWQSLQAAAREAGHALSLTAAHRSESLQASLLRGRFEGLSDAAIDRALRLAAVPGYSKHHTGYAIDVRSSTGGGFAFAGTAAYAWLAADNFANAKRHGWIPSYPDGSAPAGPVPEPWEYVWVGETNILCADFTATPDRPFCDAQGSTFEADIRWLLDNGITTGCRVDRFCPDRDISRAEIATMLWRYEGQPPAEVLPPFVDLRPGAYYQPAVAWLAAAGHTTGTTPTTFAPDRPVTRAELVTLLWRLVDRPEPAAEVREFDDVPPDSFAAVAVRWARATGVTTGTSPTTFAPDRPTSRGEAAAFIQRVDALFE